MLDNLNINMSLPYRIVLIAGLLLAVMFGISPWLTMRQIADAAANNDAEAWPALVKGEALRDYADKMLNALLDMKMYAELEKDGATAVRNNLQSKLQVRSSVQTLSQPQGFSHLVCGELQGDVKQIPADVKGCWSLDGAIHWESPLRVRVLYTHPETHWQSSLILQRTGLFSWQAVDIELPIDEILGRFAASVNL